MGLVWMCTEYTWDLNGYTEYTRDFCGCAPSIRGCGMDMHECTWDWCGCTPSTRGTCMDKHRVHVGLVGFARNVGLVRMCI
jgi:hypothetical protein